jgi:hypothetical protein
MRSITTGGGLAILGACVLGAVAIANYRPAKVVESQSNTYRRCGLNDNGDRNEYELLKNNIGSDHYNISADMNNRKEIARIMLNRSTAERKIAREVFENQVEFAKHLQRASDYDAAAFYYVKTGSFPPGFDFDLATK